MDLEIIPIDFKMWSVEWGVGNKWCQHALNDLTTIILDAGEETVIVGREDQHLLTRHGEGLDGHRHGGHDTNGVEHPLALDPPLVATLEPGDDSHIIVLSDMGIAKHRMLGATLDGLLDGRGYGKVHIGNPKGDDIAVGFFIPFHATRVSPLYDFIKIVFHIAVPSNYLLASLTLLSCYPLATNLNDTVVRLTDIFIDGDGTNAISHDMTRCGIFNIFYVPTDIGLDG